MSLIRLTAILSRKSKSFQPYVVPLANFSDDPKKPDDNSHDEKQRADNEQQQKSAKSHGSEPDDVLAGTNGSSEKDKIAPPTSVKAKAVRSELNIAAAMKGITKDLSAAKNKKESETLTSSQDEETQNKGKTLKKLGQSKLDELLDSMSVMKTSNHKRFTLPQPLGYKKLQAKVTAVEKVQQEKKPKIDEITKDVADDLGGDKIKTESELLRKLKLFDQVKTDTKQESIFTLMTDMKVEKTKVARDDSQQTKSDFVRRAGGEQYDQSKRQFGRWSEEQPIRAQRNPRATGRQTDQGSRVNLFGEKPLGIFTAELPDSSDTLQTWAELERRELLVMSRQPPRNYFEKMALWTDQGKIWKFPIDNEQGLEEEAKISFAEHVFLDEHLESWCPKTGPVRKFMDLVCVGLSKNPYYTVQQKIDHINWYKNYFEEKKEVLQRSIIEQKSSTTATPELTQ